MSLEDALKDGPAAQQEEIKETPASVDETIQDADELNDLPQLSEIEVLRKRADTLGLRYRSNTGVDKLRAMVNAAIEGAEPVTDDEPEEEAPAAVVAQVAAPAVTQENPPVTEEVIVPRVLSKQAQRAAAREAARKLVRVRITCHNPQKTEHTGELFTFGNSVLGTVKRFVPFEVEWHVEQAILNMIRARKYQYFYNTKAGERTVRTSKLVNEFSIEELPSLTASELKDLAQRQAMSNGTQEQA